MMKKLLSSLALVLAFVFAFAVSGTAEAKFAFPHNHPDIEWKTIDTEHFQVHYPVSRRGGDKAYSAEWAARKSAEVAEEMWPKMCAAFNYYLKEKVHIVILDQGDELQGFTIPSWDWIEISANPGYSFYRMRGRMEWFSDVLVHEFAHVVSLKAYATLSEGAFAVATGGLYQDGVNDADTGVSFTIGDGDSVFWTEGGAEYWSDDVGYNWWTASRDMNIRMTVLEDRLLTFDEWDTRSGKWGWNDSERYYQQGYNFGLYLRQRFGNDTYAKFAHEFGKGWRADFDSVIEDVVGVTEEELYNDWKQYLTEKYNAQWERVRAKGEVVGQDMQAYGKPWLYTDPEGRDKWNDEYKDYEQEREKQKTGTSNFEPRVSPDGKYFGFASGRGINASRWDERTEKALTGYSPTDPSIIEEMTRQGGSVPHQTYGGAWDFVPDEEALIFVGNEDFMRRTRLWGALGLDLEADGYRWNQLMRWNFPVREKKEGNRTITTWEHKKFLGKEYPKKGEFEPIPNTYRGSDPAVSPDGQRIAYFEYGDGTMNLVRINMDGSEKKRLTDWHDGTWMQRVDWSPDGKQLVLAVFRNYQQNLYIVDAETGEMEALTWDSWEEMDAHWAHDGNIYFSADCDGIFNIFKVDPETKEFTQLTNVIGAAQSPFLTPEGNLVYVYYTAHGFKLHGISGAELMNAPADDFFTTEVEGGVVKAALTHAEDLSHWESTTRDYRWFRSLAAPYAVPTISLENSRQTNWDFRGGFQLGFQDVIEKHAGFLITELGEDSLFVGQYFYQDWYPTIGLQAIHYQGKFDLAYLVDQDDDFNTTDDQSTYESRNGFNYSIVAPFLSYPWNNRLDVQLMAQGIQYNLQSATDNTFEPYLQQLSPSLTGFWTNIPGYYQRSPNPPSGRYIMVNLAHGWTDILAESQGGVLTDDGQLFDDYQFNSFMGRWTEQINIPTLGGIPFLKKARDKSHRIQMDMQLGAVDRNVTNWDEFNAGGRHPYWTGNGSIRPNTLFAGYPGGALSGETMAIVNLAYRFPLTTPYSFHKAGVLSQHGGVWMQVGGTAGNLWSYRPPLSAEKTYYDRFDERIAYDADDIRREVPFFDEAYKNGNRVLFDAQAEIRVPAVMFNTMSWNSFFRVAYGFNEVGGYGDVDGNSIFEANDNGLGDGLSQETEKPGPRFYLGLGTGW